ncbi:M56 family metallopeptidase, partial [Planctomycetota bacterium]
MNTVIEIVNHFAELWAGQMWAIIWQSLALSGLVLIVSLVFRRISANVKFWLWMLVPLRLLVMPLITISLPLLPAITHVQVETPQAYPAMTESIAAESLPSAQSFESRDEAYDYTPISSSQAVEASPVNEVAAMRIRPNLWACLMAAWLAGVAFWTGRLFWGWRKIRRIAGNAARVGEEPVMTIAEKAAAMVGLKNAPKILVTKNNISPFLFGVFQPVLIVPREFLSNVSQDWLLAVFAHEFAHLRRKDTLVGWLLAICEAIYFFHPVFHFVKKRILFERERACDDWVIATADSHKSVYANALINAADICRDFNSSLSPVGAVAESFGDLKKRIIAIGSNLKPKTKLSKTAFFLLIVIGIVCVPGFVLTNRTNAGLTNEISEIVQGFVKDRDGQAVPNAEIFLYHNISTWDFENRVEQIATSAGDGSFRFDETLKYNDVSEYPYGRDS